MPAAPNAHAPRDRLLLALLLAAGLALSALLAARSQIGGDQLNLLARGWLLVEEGTLIPYGNPGSSGGVAPGAVTSLLVAPPLALWRDARAPVALIVASHLAAFLFLDDVIRRCLSRRERLLFALLYWLAPTRLAFSSFLWNPCFLFLPAAVHAWTAFRQRHAGRFLDSSLHVAAVGLAVQVHASAVLLGAASLVLLFRRHLKVHWPGALAGTLPPLLTLAPWVLAVTRDPALLPVGEGFPSRGLLLVFPMVRGLLNWLRYPSLHLSQKVTDFDFSTALGGRVDQTLAPLAAALAQIAGLLSVVLVLLATLWFARRLRRAGRWKVLAQEAGDRAWLEGYALWCFAGALAVFAAAPTTLMWWQGIALFHVAVLAPVLWVGALWRSRAARAARAGVAAYGVLALLLSLAVAYGSPQFRCVGRGSVNLPLRSDHPMIRELVQPRCEMPVNVRGGWWPDVLPEASPPPFVATAPR
jgi:hypothetical protein